MQLLSCHCSLQVALAFAHMAAGQPRRTQELWKAECYDAAAASDFMRGWEVGSCGDDAWPRGSSTDKFGLPARRLLTNEQVWYPCIKGCSFVRGTAPQTDTPHIVWSGWHLTANRRYGWHSFPEGKATPQSSIAAFNTRLVGEAYSIVGTLGLHTHIPALLVHFWTGWCK